MTNSNPTVPHRSLLCTSSLNFRTQTPRVSLPTCVAAVHLCINSPVVYESDYAVYACRLILYDEPETGWLFG